MSRGIRDCPEIQHCSSDVGIGNGTTGHHLLQSAFEDIVPWCVDDGIQAEGDDSK